MSEWRWTTIGELTTNFDSLRRPVKSSDRKPGAIPYYGASGIIDWVDGYTHDGEYLLVAEDGENLRSRNTPIAFMSRGKAWINNHAHVVAGNHRSHTRFLEYLFAQTDVLGYLTGSAQPKLSRSSLDSIAVHVPALPEQVAIAEILGALDDKIAANTRVAAASVRLAENLYLREVLSAKFSTQPLGQVATTVLGGTPSRQNQDFWTSGSVPWLNSGKANEDRITQPSAYITDEALRRSAAKLMPEGTTVIAITGATLGQVSRLEIAASGNQSLVGIWSENRALNDWLYFAIRDQIPELLKKATGAAQQHVNKRDVDSLPVPIARSTDLDNFSTVATPLLKVAASADIQNLGLAATRDALLPQLMSGKLRVKDAEKVLENAGV